MAAKVKLGSAHLDLVVKNGTPQEVAEWLRFPLEMALAEGNVQLAQDLVDTGANIGPGWKGRGGRSLLDAASTGGEVGALGLVLKGKHALDDLNTPCGVRGIVPLMRAIDCRHTHAARLLVNAGADVRVTDIDGCTPLHQALRCCSMEIAELLIVAGSDVNAKDLKGVTPTHLTISSGIGGTDKLLDILLQRKVDVNVVDVDGASLVHTAVEAGKSQCLQDLLGAGAKPDTKNKWGNTPLLLAALFRKSVDIVSMLASRCDVNVNATNRCGNTPLVEAMRKGNVEMASVLLEAGADANFAYVDRDHRSALPLLFLAKESVPMTELLCAHGANIDTGAGFQFGFSAVHWVAAAGTSGVLKKLCEHGNMDVDAPRFGDLLKDHRRFKGGTPLLVAVLYGRLKCIKTLLAMFSDVNVQEDSGLTPLAGLCWGLSAGGLEWRVKVADLLLRSGADEKLANEDGKTPLDLFSDEQDPGGIMKRLLQNAHVDRVWRRRGMWVMLRSRLAGKLGTRGWESCSGRKKRSACSSSEKQLWEWVGRVNEEGVFRAIVAFL